MFLCSFAVTKKELRGLTVIVPTTDLQYYQLFCFTAKQKKKQYVKPAFWATVFKKLNHEEFFDEIWYEQQLRANNYYVKI